MIKGIRLYIVVLFLASSIWIASSVKNKHRQRRQLMNYIYRQQLRNAKYFSPIPIQMPSYYRRQIETATSDNIPKRSTIQSPWMPLRGPYTDEINKNVYVPPLRSPTVIITKKPEKSIFNVPLTKSIKVSQVKPNQQATGALRKKVIHVHVIRTTENPLLKAHGAVAESTVQSLLNFTPADDLWRPKFFTTPYPAVMPNHRDFGKNLGSKVDKHLNYTGIKYGTVNSVMKTMPQRGAAIKTMKNETNFFMKFTPEDVKYSSVEVKTEKISVPSNVDRPDIKHLSENYENHRIFYNDAINSEKAATNLRKEGNLPYQGHKTTNGKVTGFGNNSPSSEFTEDYRGRKSVFDAFQNSQKTNTDFMEKDIPKFQGKGSFLHEPYEAEKMRPSAENKENFPYDRDRNLRVQQYSNLPIKNLQGMNQNYPDDHRNVLTQSHNVHKIGENQHIKSNYPYQGHATVVNKPSFTTYTGYRYQNKFHFPNRNQQYRPTHQQMINGERYKNIYNANNPIVVHNDLSNTNHQNITSSYALNNPITRNKDFGLVNRTLDNQSYKYDLVSKLSKTNNTIDKDRITVVKDPETIDSRVTDSPDSLKVLVPDDLNKIKSDRNHLNTDRSVSSPNLLPTKSVSPEGIRTLQKNQSTRFELKDAMLEKPTFNEIPKLKEIKLKNPPDHLRFGDEDHFLKPMVPTYLDKENYPEVKTSTDTLTKYKPVVSSHQNNDENKEIENNISKKPPDIKTSKVENYDDTKLDEKKFSKETEDDVYFQPVLPNTAIYNHKDAPHKRLQKYVNDQTLKQIPTISKESVSKSKPSLNKPNREHVRNHEASKEKYKINKDVIITKNTNYSPEDTKRSNILEPPDDMPRIITPPPPPIITMKYDPMDLDPFGGNGKPNRTDNYVIQRKPALLPESSNRPRKPNVTISTGMLAGILIAALVFLGFLTGSMVYAFHQWKFGRRRSDRQKTTRNPVFPPEYLDENFAGNTYIHNNIFLPTPPNIEDRMNSDPDNNSITEDEITHELPSTSRVRRNPVYRERRDD